MYLYAVYKVSYVSVDYGIHVGIAEELVWSDPVQMFKEHPEPIWHLAIRAAMIIGGFDGKRAAGLVSGGLCALTYLLAAHFLYRAVGRDATARDTRCQSLCKGIRGRISRIGERTSVAGTADFYIDPESLGSCLCPVV